MVCVTGSGDGLLCPDGLNCYAHVSDSVSYNYAQAKAKCDCLGGHLVNIETVDEYNAISPWLATKGELIIFFTTFKRVDYLL